MLYLIGGASRSGKTLLAKDILEHEKVGYLSLDWIMMGFTHGMPEYGIHDKLMPDEIAGKLWVFLKPMLTSMIWSGIDYVVEGEALLPGLIQELNGREREAVSACFLGYAEVDIQTKLDQIREFRTHERDWLAREDDSYVLDHIRNMIRFSRHLKLQCDEYGFRYIETTRDFLSSIEEAKYHLFTK
jgi:2-phosphoglycerate kinase